MEEIYKFADEIIQDIYLGEHDFDLFEHKRVDGYYKVEIGQDDLLLVKGESYLDCVHDYLRYRAGDLSVNFLRSYFPEYDSEIIMNIKLSNDPGSTYRDIQGRGKGDELVKDYINTYGDEAVFKSGESFEYDFSGDPCYVYIREHIMDRDWEFVGGSEHVL